MNIDFPFYVDAKVLRQAEIQVSKTMNPEQLHDVPGNVIYL